MWYGNMSKLKLIIVHMWNRAVYESWDVLMLYKCKKIKFEIKYL